MYLKFISFVLLWFITIEGTSTTYLTDFTDAEDTALLNNYDDYDPVDEFTGEEYFSNTPIHKDILGLSAVNYKIPKQIRDPHENWCNRLYGSIYGYSKHNPCKSIRRSERIHEEQQNLPEFRTRQAEYNRMGFSQDYLDVRDLGRADYHRRPAYGRPVTEKTYYPELPRIPCDYMDEYGGVPGCLMYDDSDVEINIAQDYLLNFIKGGGVGLLVNYDDYDPVNEFMPDEDMKITTIKTDIPGPTPGNHKPYKQKNRQKKMCNKLYGSIYEKAYTRTCKDYPRRKSKRFYLKQRESPEYNTKTGNEFDTTGFSQDYLDVKDLNRLIDSDSPKNAFFRKPITDKRFLLRVPEIPCDLLELNKDGALISPDCLMYYIDKKDFHKV